MMERLTERNKNGVAVMRLDIPAGALGGAVARLAAYEDTGMTPEEIAEIKAERDAAVRDLEELILHSDTCAFCGRDSRSCARECRPK